ncbi:cupin domain-containing protein [Oceanispirochaeta sp.]|jgi:quercetin dioxygenase-like cupin family protein|uniref:cupin domain-containing protein n=1 Tax=Oceanispirochaeta sp. TaxID=2035350 RepID=UPI002615E2C6|nr:cupin domain-containing protein [Oceanispirochaeta sp.]MDA3955974.1 cupin domain-containing protein [Oceanispirochaeta sp.]
MELKNFFPGDDQKLEDLGDGVKRKITAFHDNLMCVEVHFEKGAVGALHSHPHEQISYIVSGEFEFTIGGEKKILKAGDSTLKQPDIEHGALCLKAGMLLDFFTPCREDFL